MNGRDAFEEEMGFLGRISDHDAERALAARAPSRGGDTDLDELASFVVALRASVPVHPDPAVEESLVSRLARRARAAGERAAIAPTAEVPAAGDRSTRRWRPRLVLAAKVAIAVAFVPAFMSGLAFAGVSLPEPAREAFDRVGIELPNQPGAQMATSDDRAGGDGGQPTQSRGAENRGAEADRGTASAEPANRGARERRNAERDRPQGSSEAGNGGQAASPSETGPTGVPPGHGGTPPGQGGTPPGQSSPPPGQGGTPPGQGGAIPGSGSGGQSAEPHGGGPPGGVPPGEAKPK